MLLLLVAARLPIGLALLITGFGGTAVLHDLNAALFSLGSSPVETLSNYSLSMLPMFVLMGAFAVRGGLSEGMFRAANAFIGHRRGGLAMASIVACAGFGAVCGSSLATVTTMARITVPEMLRYGYSPKLASGTVAAGGTLGILIPPSMLMVIYAVLTETSIGRLFAAGIVPGVLATLLYLAAIAIWMRLRPELAPPTPRTPWGERFRELRGVLGIVALFGLTIGGIFAGWFSPTEGAAVGAFGALALGVVTGKLDSRGFVEAVKEAVIVSAMLFLLVIGISLFEFFMEAARVPEQLGRLIGGLDLPRYAVMVVIILMLALLGCVLDAIAMVFIVTPVLFPIVQSLGFDLIWFGIVMVMVVEFGLITPPFGMNVFVIAKLTPQVNTWGAFTGVMPFIASDVIRIGLIVAFPAIALWLPNLIFGTT
ncbi:MAG: TRAP transporter large permease [Bauldia litoralis]